METPRTLRQRPSRNPTPRLSERKKSLFTSSNAEVNSDSEQENYVIDGVAPLSGNKNKVSNVRRNSIKGTPVKVQNKSISFLKSNNASPERMDDDVFDKLPESPPQNELILSPTSGRQLRAGNKLPPSAHLASTPSPMARRRCDLPSTQQQKALGDELPTLFTNSMNLNKHKKLVDEHIVEESSSDDERFERSPTTTRKRSNLASNERDSVSDAKIRRLENTQLSISTKSFYSHKKTSPVQKSPPMTAFVKRSPKNKRHKPSSPRTRNINKGVHHKIRRKPKSMMATKADVMSILSTIQNEKLRNLLTAKRLERDQIENCHRILNYGKNPIEMAKPLSVIGRGNEKPACPINDDNNNNGEPKITQGMCYNKKEEADISLGFSDIECSSESDEEWQGTESIAGHSVGNETDEEPENRVPTPVAGRKFFKSGYSTATKKEVKITENIKASMQNGKLKLMQKQRRRKIKLRNNQTNEFSSEQARVDEILKSLDVSTLAAGDTESPPVPDYANQIELTCATPTQSIGEQEDFEEVRVKENEEEDEYYEFRRRLPYNTNDPELIEQQHTLLDFLITNKICTEENFITFIADPENHKEEAQRIIDQLVVVVGENPEDYLQRIPYNTVDPVEIEQQKNFIQFLIENDLCNEENFQIFIADYANRQEEADRIITEVVARTHNISAEDLERELNKFNAQSESTSMELEIPDQNKQYQAAYSAQAGDITPEKYFPVFYPGRWQPLKETKSSRKVKRPWNAGHGMDQYQIDAGQKEYGARQCKQCGLVYSVHEPEEEKLHKEFHSSMFILKFKSWIDEDIVQIYPEWANDGRIIRITNNSHPKRQERLRDVLQLVDKELGFSSYIMPKCFTAYFAVRQCQIAGVCLAEPLAKAHRYISVNGVDCCTEETFDAKCGISRIWVSPLHRRFHIATKLIRAVQLYTIFGEEIPMDKLAFSAPTQDGKKFAKNVSKTENFLVYQ